MRLTAALTLVCFVSCSGVSPTKSEEPSVTQQAAAKTDPVADTVAKAEQAVSEAENVVEEADAGKSPAAQEEPTDLLAHLRVARAHAAERDYEAALSEYLACWDHGADNPPAWMGIRPAVFEEIESLAPGYPKAHQTLVDRRDRAMKEFEAKTADDATALDLAYLNEHLGEPERNLELFDALTSLAEKDRKLKAALLFKVFDQLMAARRYSDIVKAPGLGGTPEGVVAFAGRVIEARELRASVFGSSTRKTGTVEAVAPWYEALLGAGHSDAAEQMVKLVLDFDGSNASVRVLAKHARRAGEDKVAKGLLERLR